MDLRMDVRSLGLSSYTAGLANTILANEDSDSDYSGKI